MSNEAMEEPVSPCFPDFGAVRGLKRAPIRENFYIFSRYSWGSRHVADVFGAPVVPLWFSKVSQKSRSPNETINWSLFKKMPLGVLAHKGQEEFEFAIRTADAAAAAGVFTFFAQIFHSEQAEQLELNSTYCAWFEVILENSPKPWPIPPNVAPQKYLKLPGRLRWYGPIAVWQDKISSG